MIHRRAVAWVLTLVLAIGLGSPVLGAPHKPHGHAHAAPEHVHSADDAHAKAPASIPGPHDDCLTPADCALGHLGFALASAPIMAHPAAAIAEYAGAARPGHQGHQPDRDPDPPKPATLR